MTEERLPLAELLAKAGDGDFLRSVAEAVVQLLMETDVEGLIGAGPARTLRRAHDLSQRLPGPDAWTRASAACSCASPSCGRAATSRPSSSRGRRRRRPWWR